VISRLLAVRQLGLLAGCGALGRKNSTWCTHATLLWQTSLRGLRWHRFASKDALPAPTGVIELELHRFVAAAQQRMHGSGFVQKHAQDGSLNQRVKCGRASGKRHTAPGGRPSPPERKLTMRAAWDEEREVSGCSRRAISCAESDVGLPSGASPLASTVG
jgi:hypothetical protein